MLIFKPNDQLVLFFESITIPICKKVLMFAKKVAESKIDEKAQKFFDDVKKNGIDITPFIKKYIYENIKK